MEFQGHSQSLGWGNPGVSQSRWCCLKPSSQAPYPHLVFQDITGASYRPGETSLLNASNVSVVQQTRVLLHLIPVSALPNRMTTSLVIWILREAQPRSQHHKAAEHQEIAHIRLAWSGIICPFPPGVLNPHLPLGPHVEPHYLLFLTFMSKNSSVP